MNRFFIILGISLILILSTASTISFKVLVPSQVTLPAEINSIAIIDRTEPVNSNLNFTEGTLSEEDKRIKQEAVITVIDGLISVMRNSPRFKVTRTRESISSIVTEDDFPELLSWEQVSELCNKYDVDAILSFENFNFDFSVSKETRLNTTEYAKEGDLIIPRNEVIATARTALGFRIYYPAEKIIADEYRFSHNRSWEKSGNTPEEAMKALISKNEAIKNVSYNSGVMYAQRITPAWNIISRTYYRKSQHDPDIVKGAIMMENQDWQKAITAFERSIQNGKRKTKGRASHNLAVVYEIIGDFEKAIFYAGEAYEKYRNKPSRDYLEELNKRLKDQELLKDQLNKN